MQRRAAIYARYSTTLQSDRSIEDQVELCRNYLRREGYQEVGVFADRAMSSETLIGRLGLAQLIKAAKERRFDAIVVECVDRISRDSGDLHHISKQLRFFEIEIISATEGIQSDLQIGFRGLMGIMYLKDLRAKIHRGMAGNIREGLSAGGKAYGYRPVAGKPGELQIDEAEADVIREIYRSYAGGSSPRKIACDLNTARVLPPRGRRWNASTLNGNAGRGYGILRNAIYAGVLVWDRVKMVLDPMTGKRVSRGKPEDDWKYAEVPHLRIVDEDLWNAVQARLKAQAHAKLSGHSTRQPMRPFSGILRCGSCGGGMAIHDRKGSAIRIRCSTASESGSCDNKGRFRLDEIETAIFSSLFEYFMHPAYLKEYIQAYAEECRTLIAAPKTDRTKLERAAAEARRSFERLLGLYQRGIIDGVDGENELRKAKANLREAEGGLRSLDVDTRGIVFDPATPARYAAALQDLKDSIMVPGQNTNVAARDAIRMLISEIVVSPLEDDGVPVEVRGRLSALISPPNNKVGGLMVAEERSAAIPPILWGRVAA